MVGRELLWRWALALAVALAVVAAFTPSSRAQWLVVVAGVGAVLVTASPALARGTGNMLRRHPLGLISVGLWLTVMGEVLHAAGAGYPSYADALELAAYPVIIMGLLRLVRARLRERPLDTLLVAAIAPTALGAFAWMPLVDGVSHWVPGAHTAATMAVAFLVVDILAVAMLVRLTVMFRGRPLAYQLLLATFAALLGAHVSRAAASMTSVVPAPFGSQTLMVLAFGLIAAAAMHPSLLPATTAMRPRPAPIGRSHIAMLAMAVVVAPVIVTLQHANAGPWLPYAAGAPALISLLAIAHLGRLVRERSRLEHESTHDLLTGLPNRGRFNDEVVRALVSSGAPRFAIGFIDLDRFKKVNDSLGHDAGDELLRQVSRRLQENVRNGDFVARLAGDEFAVLLRDVPDQAAGVSAARRMLDGFAAEFDLHGHSVFMTPSVGLSVAPEHGTDAEALLKHADLAMYEAKRQGRNTVSVYTSRLGADSRQQLAVETRLHTGIEAGELVVHYQPKVSLRTGAVTGVEALVRWRHPTIGLVAPGAFIHLAEETGLVALIGEQVLNEACRQVQQWRCTEFADLTLSVNLSTRQFQLHDVPAVVSQALESSGLPPYALELEVTESSELGQAEHVAAALEAVRALGVRCSVDDFGTGYTGIAYLNDLPIDKIKLDKSFIDTIGNDADDAPFVRAMIAMAHSLGLEVIAEGVETPEQAMFLRAQGCDTMQGFLFSRPLPADDLENLLAALQDTAQEPTDTLRMPGARPTVTTFGDVTDVHDLGNRLWLEEQRVVRLVPPLAAETDDDILAPAVARRTLVLSSAASVVALPLFLGLGSAGALPPAMQHAVAATLTAAGVTPAAPSHHTRARAEAAPAYTGTGHDRRLDAESSQPSGSAGAAHEPGRNEAGPGVHATTPKQHQPSAPAGAGTTSSASTGTSTNQSNSGANQPTSNQGNSAKSHAGSSQGNGKATPAAGNGKTHKPKSTPKHNPKPTPTPTPTPKPQPAAPSSATASSHPGTVKPTHGTGTTGTGNGSKSHR